MKLTGRTLWGALMALAILGAPLALAADPAPETVAIVEKIGGMKKVFVKQVKEGFTLDVKKNAFEELGVKNEDFITEDDLASLSLTKNHVVGTQKKSFAQLKFNKKFSLASFSVGFDSVVHVKNLTTEKNKQTVELSLDSGTVHCKIPKVGANEPGQDVKVVTPTAVVGARGTEFIVGYNPKDRRTEIKVLEGRVKVELMNKIQGKISDIELKAGEFNRVGVNSGIGKTKTFNVQNAQNKAQQQFGAEGEKNGNGEAAPAGKGELVSVSQPMKDAKQVATGDPKAGAQSTSSGGSGGTGAGGTTGGGPSSLDRVFESKPPVGKIPPKVPPTGTEIPGH